ncbi:hypothetical protein R6Q57_011892 [Mikania cordata]
MKAEAHNVKVIGEGQETVVLSHGFGTDQSLWKHLLPDLATEPSYKPAILEELKLTRCVFVGHSLSCMISLIASVLRPDLFVKLVFISPSCKFVNTDDFYGGFKQHDVDQLYEAMKTEYLSWCLQFARLIVGGDTESVAMIFESDLRNLLGQVQVPCHIIQSCKDAAVPTTVTDYMHRNIGNTAIVEIIQIEGHIPQLSAPGVFVPVLLRHIK